MCSATAPGHGSSCCVAIGTGCGWRYGVCSRAGSCGRMPGERVWTLSAEQFAWLCAGVDWQRLSIAPMAGALPV